MFDLNLSDFSPEAVSDGVDTESEKILGVSISQMENSGTSNSSVVNVDSSSTAGDVDSCFDHQLDVSAFNFGRLKSSTGVNGSNSRGVVISKNLFPTDTREVVAESARTERWLDLSGSFHGSPKTTIVNQAQQQRQMVKKSRRGPRSRSSQYRGVTFYRRTGRWESHIWYCTNLISLLCCGSRIILLSLLLSFLARILITFVCLSR